MHGNGSDTLSTATTTRQGLATTLGATIDRAAENGHDIQELPEDAPVAPGVFARCTLCDAHLRFYMGRGMGEAYSTACRMQPVRVTSTVPDDSVSRETPTDDVACVEHMPVSRETQQELSSALVKRPSRTIPDATSINHIPEALNQWADAIYAYAQEKGWLTEPDRANVGELVALMHTELSELYEDYRNGLLPNESRYEEDTRGNMKPVGIPSEVADLIIRALHFAAIYGIDVEAAVREKHRYNLTRPYRHGGKRT